MTLPAVPDLSAGDVPYGSDYLAISQLLEATVRPTLAVLSMSGTQSIASGAFDEFVWDVVEIDTAGTHSGTTWTAPADGYYQATGSIDWPANATGIRIAKFQLAGALVQAGATHAQAITVALQSTATVAAGIYHLLEGETLELSGFQSSGGPLAARAWLQIVRVYAL